MHIKILSNFCQECYLSNSNEIPKFANMPPWKVFFCLFWFYHKQISFKRDTFLLKTSQKQPFNGSKFIFIFIINFPFLSCTERELELWKLTPKKYFFNPTIAQHLFVILFSPKIAYSQKRASIALFCCWQYGSTKSQILKLKSKFEN